MQSTQGPHQAKAGAQNSVPVVIFDITSGSWSLGDLKESLGHISVEKGSESATLLNVILLAASPKSKFWTGPIPCTACGSHLGVLPVERLPLVAGGPSVLVVYGAIHS